MSDELTPWEDINPLTVSAPRQEPRSKSLDTKTTFRNELTACLALTAPAGMTEEARRDWLTVAWDTLKDIPPDILTGGCRIARQKCDHPSKIVPTIIAETADWMRLEREHRRDRTEVVALPAPAPDYCTPEQARKILADVGLKSHFPSSRETRNYPTIPSS